MHTVFEQLLLSISQGTVARALATSGRFTLLRILDKAPLVRPIYSFPL